MRYKKIKNTNSKVDLTDRKNINIIESQKTKISDEDIKILEKQLKDDFEQAEEFYNIFVQKELMKEQTIPDDVFGEIMKDLLKQHKIIKDMIE